MPSSQNTYMVGIRSVADYSPFGVELDGRTASNSGYRYSFQGQEKDDEIKGEGNSINYKYRMHDPRVGRFFAVDPLKSDYPHYSPYSHSGNKLIAHVELEGLEELHYLELQADGKTWGAVKINGKDWVDINNDLDENVNVYLYHNPGGGIKKSVYKSHQQGGKDRWEYKGGLAPSNLLRAHYDTDQYNVPTDADRINSTPYDPSEGGDDAGNNGGRLGGQHGWNNGGKQLFFGTIGIVTAPFTIAAGGVYALAGGVSLANSVDDVAGAVSNDEGQSLLENLTSDTNYGQLVKDLKVGATFVTAIGGGAQLWTMGADAPTLIGTANDIRSLTEKYLESDSIDSGSGTSFNNSGGGW